MVKFVNLKDKVDLNSKELEECYKLINKYKKLFIAIGNL